MGNYRIAQLYVFQLILCTLLLSSQAYSRSVSSDSIAETPDTILLRMEQVQTSISRISAAASRGGLQMELVRRDFPAVKTSLAAIKNDFSVLRISDVKTLSNYQALVKELQSRLAEWRSTLAAYNKQLQQESDELLNLSKDSLLAENTADSLEKKVYGAELKSIKTELTAAGKAASASLDSVGLLLTEVSESYLASTELLHQINAKMKESGKSSFGKEAPFLWNAANLHTAERLPDLLRASYRGQQRVLSYFLDNTWDNRILLILIGLFFFIWVFRNARKTTSAAYRDQLKDFQFQYLHRLPILSALIVMLSLAPLVEPGSPPIYIEILHFILLIALTLFFRKHWRRQLFYSWVIIVAIYVTIALSNTILNSGLVIRLWLIGLNLISVYLGFLFYRKLRKLMLLKKFVKPVAVIYIALNLLSILANIFGRISMAKTFSMTAIIGLTQIIGLSAFVQILSEAIDLQIKISSCSTGLLSRVNLQKVRAVFRQGLSIIAVFIWVLVFTINLSISEPLFGLLSSILSKERTLGSITFSIGHIVLFIVILYISNFLQKYIGILFGEENATFGVDQAQRKSSKLVLLRLLVFILGFLLAVSAAGFSLDKLTVIIGALGVGIGLGMQNIVNNFVSGIILIFEKPFQIGDFIELADKKGRVKDIGIRSSKLITQQGSEVIVPNGDLLSGRLVNWTLSNNFLKAELTFKVESSADLDLVKKIVNEEVKKMPHSIKKTEAEVLFNAFTADSIELKIQAWVDSVYNEAAFKSQLLHSIYLRLKEKDIRML